MPPSTTLTPTARTLLTLSGFIIVLAGLHAVRDILAPALLAAVLVIIVHPLRHPLERRGWPKAAATTVVIVAAYLILAAMLAMLLYAGIKFSGLVAHYAAELRQTASDLTSSLDGLGFDTTTSDVAASVVNPTNIQSVVTHVGNLTLTLASGLFVVVTYVLFMAVDAARYDGAREAFGATQSSVLDRAHDLFGGVRLYFVVSAIFGAIVAVIDGLALWWLGIPAPIVWAILAFVTNFIPNIGFVLGLLPPAVLALVVGGWPLMLGVIAIYCLVNVVLQVLVQPKFVADAVNITVTLSFISVVFWTFVIGPLGAILAIPMTLLARAALLQGGPETAWYSWLSGDTVTDVPGPGVTADEVTDAAGPVDHAVAADTAVAAEKAVAADDGTPPA